MGMYGLFDMKLKIIRSANLRKVTSARSVDHTCLYQAVRMR